MVYHEQILVTNEVIWGVSWYDGTKLLPEVLNHCRILISEILWHSHENIFLGAQATILYDEFEDLL